MHVAKGIISVLSEAEVLWEFTPNSRLMIQHKLSRGEEFIEIGSWNKWIQDQQFHPTKNRLFVEKRALREVLPLIAKSIE